MLEYKIKTVKQEHVDGTLMFALAYAVVAVMFIIPSLAAVHWFQEILSGGCWSTIDTTYHAIFGGK